MITVIVPYWNAERWLGRCCKSLTEQSGDFEFILVSDYCRDGSDDIAMDYACRDKRITVLWNTRSKGVSGARNTGINYASGEWITFLDADDEMLPNAYETFQRVIMVRTADIYQLNHLRYYAAVDRLALKYYNEGGRYIIPDLPQCWFGVWNKLYSAELIKGIQFDEDLQYGEDGLFNLECLARTGYIQHADKLLTTTKHRFENKESLSHVKDADALLKQIHAYEAFLLKQGDPVMRQLLCNMIADLWTNGRTMKLIGLKE